MQQLRQEFGATPGGCFYFLPNIGTFNDLVGVNGNLLDNSFMVDVAHLPEQIPTTHRKNGYHYLYLNAEVPEATITSEPFKPKKVFRAGDFARQSIHESSTALPTSKKLIGLARELDKAGERIANLFFRNAALAVFPTW